MSLIVVNAYLVRELSENICRGMVANRKIEEIRR